MTDERGILSIVLGRREVVMPSETEDYRYLKQNWNSVYTIIRPGNAQDVWMAIAKFGNGDELIADTADILLDLIRHHYGPPTEGYTEMLMARMGKKYS
jgi:hypothetical protein